MPVVMGKKLSQPAISAFGSTPVSPILPSTTTTIGAIASTGIAWLAISHGIKRAVQRADVHDAGRQCDAGDE